MSILDEFERVSKRTPCPVCGRADWCLVDSPGDPAKVLCQRTESDKRWGDAGYLHVLRDDDEGGAVRQRTRRALLSVLRKPKRIDLADHADRWAQAADPKALERVAGRLGVTVASLIRLGTGWATAKELQGLGTSCRSSGAWSFPMADADGTIIGIRLRSADGFKWAVKGGAQGLFIPSNLTGEGPLLVAEGPTDLAAIIDLGFDGIGRPSCNGALRLVVRLVRRRKPEAVVIVADHDEPGQRGAVAQAVALTPYAPVVKVITSPNGIKDARAWRQAGAGRADIEAVIDAAPERRIVTAAETR